MRQVILSMATMPSRKKRLIENLPSIVNQSYMFNKLVINVYDDLSEDEYEFYNSILKYDSRIIINKVESKWRSCNKLLPTLKMYPDEIIITIDDDIYYPEHCVKYLIEQHKKTPDCIVAHEVQPIIVNKENNIITYLNGYDIKLMQKSWGKYITNCCLFPPHVFDNTEVFNYEKMFQLTNALHDEVWFWVNSTLNNVMVVGLNYVKGFTTEIITEWGEDEFRLAYFNNSQESANDYMTKVSQIYGKQLIDIITSTPVEFTVTKDNIYIFMLLMDSIRELYNYGIIIKRDDELTDMWLRDIYSIVNKDSN